MKTVNLKKVAMMTAVAVTMATPAALAMDENAVAPSADASLEASVDQKIQKLDTDKDGLVSQDEMSVDATYSEELFEEADADNDGFVSKQELITAHAGDRSTGTLDVDVNTTTDAM